MPNAVAAMTSMVLLPSGLWSYSSAKAMLTMARANVAFNWYLLKMLVMLYGEKMGVQWVMFSFCMTICMMSGLSLRHSRSCLSIHCPLM